MDVTTIAGACFAWCARHCCQNDVTLIVGLRNTRTLDPKPIRSAWVYFNRLARRSLGDEALPVPATRRDARLGLDTGLASSSSSSLSTISISCAAFLLRLDRVARAWLLEEAAREPLTLRLTSTTSSSSSSPLLAGVATGDLPRLRFAGVVEAAFARADRLAGWR